VRRFAIVTSVVLAAVGWVSEGGAQDAAPDEIALYQSWYAASEAKDVAKGYAAARDYLEKFPKGQYAAYLGKWASGARGMLFNQALEAKDMATMLRLGQERLREDPKDLSYLLALALNLRRHELFASPPDFAHAEEAADFSRRVIALVEAGQVPPGTDPAKWNRTDALAWLHQNLAIVAARQDKEDEALAAYRKSSELDPGNGGLVAYNSLMSGSILRGRYDRAVERYKALPEEQRQGEAPGAEAKAVLEEANAQADAVIEQWSRFVALAEASDSYGETRTKIRQALSDLWSFRHPDDPEGIGKRIDQSRPTESSASSRP
jgi:tetratricopeptide (TPR) repeat protein